MSDLLQDFVQVPASLEDVDITREIHTIMSTHKYKVEEQDYVEINDRLIVVQSGAIPGTVTLYGNCNLPDEQLGEAQWQICYMGRHSKQLLPLRFKGDEQRCLADIMLLRLQG